MTGQELVEHVVRLADDLDVTVWPCLNCPTAPAGRAVEGPRAVYLTKSPDEPWPYLLALHELGHHAQEKPWGKLRRLTEESLAWRWALQHTLIEPTNREFSQIHRSLRSYGDDRRHKMTPEYVELLADLELLAR